MVLLPALVLCAKIECARVLKIRREDHRLVPSFSRELDAEIPCVKRDEYEVEILGGEMFGSECIKAVDGIPERASVADMLPCQSSKARYGSKAIVSAGHLTL